MTADTAKREPLDEATNRQEHQAFPAAEERARKLAAAMRENLKRRKAQARAREEPGDKPD